MIAIDTNIVVRLIANDEPRQVARARALLEDGEVLLLTTIVLECEWVLRSMYGVERNKLNGALRAFCALPNVTLEEPQRVQRGLALHANGFDFADALHLAGAETAEVFATFDKSLCAAAARLVDGLPVREP